MPILVPKKLGDDPAINTEKQLTDLQCHVWGISKAVQQRTTMQSQVQYPLLFQI